MLQTLHTRTVEVDELSVEAERIDVVRALWEAENFYSGNLFYNSIDSVIQKPELLTHAQAEAMFEDLFTSGVLSPEIKERFQKVMADVIGEYSITPGQLSFAQVYAGYVSAQIWNDTLKTNFSIFMDDLPTMDLQAILQAYAVYLGVDGLNDWVSIPLKAMPHQYGVAHYSAQAQLYITVTIDQFEPKGGSFYLGAYSIAPQMIEQQEANQEGQ